MGLKINSETIYENGSFNKANKATQLQDVPNDVDQGPVPIESIQEEKQAAAPVEKKASRDPPLEECTRQVSMDVKMKSKFPTPPHGICHGRGVRVGNMRLYKIKAHVGDKQTIDAIVISTMSQSWKLQIPSTMPMYSWINDLYEDYSKHGERRPIQLVLNNMLNATCYTSAMYQYIIQYLTLLFADPTLKLKAGDEEKSIIELLFAQIKAAYEDLMVTRAKEKENEETSSEAASQLKEDETYHSMLEETKRID